MLPFELTKDTPSLALSGELWSVFYEFSVIIYDTRVLMYVFFTILAPDYFLKCFSINTTYRIVQYVSKLTYDTIVT